MSYVSHGGNLSVEANMPTSDTLQIPAAQIEFKKKVGVCRSKGRDVIHYKTRGGLHLMALDNGHVIGSGPHRAVAKKIAKQHEEDIEFTELSKSDHVDEEAYAHLLPKYEALTKHIRELQGLE